MGLNEWSFCVKGRNVIVIVSIFVDLDWGCGGRDEESLVSDKICYIF